jgi:uncharacterized membrane protein
LPVEVSKFFQFLILLPLSLLEKKGEPRGEKIRKKHLAARKRHPLLRGQTLWQIVYSLVENRKFGKGKKNNT